VTETRRGKTHVATSWGLASRPRAPWRWIPPPGLVVEHGTGVRLTLRNPLSPLLDAGFVAGALERHFQPLLDALFDECLARHYPRGVRFVVGSRYASQMIGWRTSLNWVMNFPASHCHSDRPTSPFAGKLRRSAV
jgi:hypothetical protein